MNLSLWWPIRAVASSQGSSDAQRQEGGWRASKLNARPIRVDLCGAWVFLMGFCFLVWCACQWWLIRILCMTVVALFIVWVFILFFFLILVCIALIVIVALCVVVIVGVSIRGHSLWRGLCALPIPLCGNNDLMTQ